jgi:hypothetical protein
MRLNKWQMAILSVLALVVSPVLAAPPAKTTTGKAAASTTNTGELVTTLHQAKTLLETAIHDYDGHRAKAVEEIHHAIHELTPHHHHKAANAATGAAKPAAREEKPANAAATTTPGENQAQSDMKLKQALQILSGLSGQFPKNHTKPAGHIQTAIEELNVALKIK